jgi:hypothetical protein
MEEPLELVEDEPVAVLPTAAIATPSATPTAAPTTAAPTTVPHPPEPPKSKIHGMSSLAIATRDWKRETHYNKTGAVRVRTFHCRLSEQGVEYLDQAINDWLERHHEIEVKFTTSVVGSWEGKLKGEPALIVMVWY